MLWLKLIRVSKMGSRTLSGNIWEQSPTLNVTPIAQGFATPLKRRFTAQLIGIQASTTYITTVRDCSYIVFLYCLSDIGTPNYISYQVQRHFSIAASVAHRPSARLPETSKWPISSLPLPLFPNERPWESDTDIIFEFMTWISNCIIWFPMEFNCSPMH